MPAGVHADAEVQSDARMRREAAKAQLHADHAEEASATRPDDDEDRGSNDAQSLSGATAVAEAEDGIRASEETATEEER